MYDLACLNSGDLDFIVIRACYYSEYRTHELRSTMCLNMRTVSHLETTRYFVSGLNAVRTAQRGERRFHLKRLLVGHHRILQSLSGHLGKPGQL